MRILFVFVFNLGKTEKKICSGKNEITSCKTRNSPP